MLNCHRELLLVIFIMFQGGLFDATVMLPCKFGENKEFNSSKQCDGVWDCPFHGGDEWGCGKCGQSFECSRGGSSCYKQTERCNGKPHCGNHGDETLCSKELCGPHNGTFLCYNLKCIKEAWKCDNTDDCGDNSDENNCPGVASRKVIIAAVIGALMCGLLLTVALGCTCRLYSMHNQQRDGQCRSPMLAIEEEIWRRQSAPPNYEEAMSTSRPVDGHSEDNSRDHTEQTGDIDDDVALLDAGSCENSVGFNDDDLLDALGAFGQSSLIEARNRNTTDNTAGVVSSDVILLSGKTCRAFWRRSNESENSNTCDTCTYNADSNEQPDPFDGGPINAVNYESDLEMNPEDNKSSDICLKCSSSSKLVYISDCQCTSSLQSHASLSERLFEYSGPDLDQVKKADDLKNELASVI